MNSFVSWNDIRTEHVERAGGEAAVEAGKRELLAEVIGHRLAEVHRARSMTLAVGAGSPVASTRSGIRQRVRVDDVDLGVHLIERTRRSYSAAV